MGVVRPGTSRRQKAASLSSRFGQLLGLSAFAFLWPVLDVWARYPEFLVAHSASRWQVAGLAAGITLGPPLALLFLEQIVTPALRVRMGTVHATMCGLLVALIAAPPLERLGEMPGVTATILALVLGTLAALSIRRSRTLRENLKYSALAIPMFLFLFIGNNSIRRALFPTDAVVQPAQSVLPIPVVVVVLDELPLAGLLTPELQINSRRFPHFARFAQEATWYREGTTAAHSTLPGVVSILTGRLWDPQRNALISDYPRNLFTLLWDSHELHVMERFTQLMPSRRDENGVFQRAYGAWPLLLRDTAIVYAHMISPPSIQSKLPPVDKNWIQFDDFSHGLDAYDQLGLTAFAQDFMQWIGKIESGTRLHYAHLVMPHTPWLYYETGRRYSLNGETPSGAGRWGVWEGRSWSVLHSQQRFLLQLGYVDHMLGLLFQRLREVGIYDEAAIVVTADHGIAFRPDDNSRGLTPTNAAEILRVPLMVRLPGQGSGGVSELPAQTTDILPTLIDVLDADVEWPMDGISLRDSSLVRRTHRIVVADERYTFAVTEDASLDPVVARNAEHFGTGGMEDVFSIGPHRRLLGSRVESFSGRNSKWRTRLSQGSLTFELDGSEKVLPAELVGDLSVPGQELDVHEIAVAVDGVIEATTQNYAERDGHPRALWSVLLPERVMTPGPHTIELFEIFEAAEGTLELRPVVDVEYTKADGDQSDERRIR